MNSGLTLPNGMQLSLNSVLKALWNRKWIVVTTAAALCAVAIFVAMRVRPVYTTEAVILVESQRIPEKFVSATVSTELQDRLNNLSERVLGYTQLLQIINRMKLYPEERRRYSPDELVRIMRNDIRIALDRNVAPGRPGAFRISYRTYDPVVGADVTNLMASFFIDENYRSREVEATGTSQFLDAQLVQAKAELERQEQRLSVYKLQHSGELPQQESGILVTLGQLKVQLMGIQDSLSRAQDNKVLLEGELSSAQALLQTLRASANGSPALAAQAAKLQPERESERLANQLASLRLRYKDRHPEVRRAAAEVARAKDQESRQGPDVAGSSGGTSSGEENHELPAAVPQAVPDQEGTRALALQQDRIQGLRAQINLASQTIARLEQEREQLTSELSNSGVHLGKLPVREQELAEITRDYEITKSNYQSLLSKKLAANVATQMERDQKSERFVLLDKAAVPEKPNSPKRAIYGTVGCVIAVLGGLMLGLALEYRKGSLLGEWELPQEVAVLSRIPQLTTAHFTPSLAAAEPPLQLPGPAYRTARLQPRPGQPVFPFDAANERAFDAYRILRTRLTQHPGRPRVIAVSSANIGDGKSVTAANLAGVLTMKPDTAVLLVDADFRTSGLASLLGLDSAPGLSEVLSGSCTLDQAIIRLEGMPQFHFLPAGELGSRATDLLDSHAWRALCDSFRERFTFTIVDCAPAGPIADLDLVRAACDSMLIVARPDHSKRKDLLQAIGSAPKLMGVVMSCAVDLPWMSVPNANSFNNELRSMQARA